MSNPFQSLKKSMTNAEKIRSMSDEDLASFLGYIGACCQCVGYFQKPDKECCSLIHCPIASFISDETTKGSLLWCIKELDSMFDINIAIDERDEAIKQRTSKVICALIDIYENSPKEESKWPKN